MLVDPLQEERQIVGHQQLHLLHGIDIQHRSDEIGQFERLRGIDQQVRHVLRNGLQMLDRGADQFLDIAKQRRDFWRVFPRFRQRRDGDAQIGCGLDRLLQLHALDTLQQQLQHIVLALNDPLDDRQGGCWIEIRQVGCLRLRFPLHRGHQHLVLQRQGGLSSRDRLGASDRHRHEDMRKQHRAFQREHRVNSVQWCHNQRPPTSPEGVCSGTGYRKSYRWRDSAPERSPRASQNRPAWHYDAVGAVSRRLAAPAGVHAHDLI